MSQVRKLLNGDKIIKAQEGYKIVLDDQMFTVTDDQLTQINNEIASLSPRYRAYLGGVSSTIKSGNFVGDRAGNRISASALSNLSDKDLKFLKQNKQNVWEAITDSDTYKAKEAINEALNIISRVVNTKPETKQETADKKVAYNRKANFNYDKNGETWVYSKSNPINAFIEGRFGSYLDWLGDDKWLDSNKWETPLGESEAILRSWYQGLGSRKAAQEAIDKAMAEVKSKPWEDVSEASKELLAYFNIGNDSESSDGSSSSSVRPDIYDENGSLRSDARTEKGGYYIVRGNPNLGQDANGWYTNWDIVDTSQKPYLITESDWPKLGLSANGEYAHGVIYQGRLYSEPELAKYPGSDLYATMEYARSVNNRTDLTGAEKNALLKNVLNWAGSDQEYGLYDSYNPDIHFFKESHWRDNLKSRNYSFFDATRAFPNANGNTVIGYYDQSAQGNLPWNFKTPSYLVYNASNKTWDDNLQDLGNYNWYASLTPFDSNKYVGDLEEHSEKKYGVFKYIKNTSTGMQIAVLFDPTDKNNTLWVRNGKWLIRLTDDVAAKVRSGITEFNGHELEAGNKKELKKTRVKFNDGGKIEHIAKLQQGLIVPQSIQIETAPEKLGTNVEQAHMFNEKGQLDWNSLPAADKEELIAMCLDLSGALAGWAGPIGSVGGAALGAIGTGFNIDVDRRRGRNPWATAGSAVVNFGLDIASALPEIGEVFQISKLAKTAAKVGKNAKLLNWVGRALNGLGLAQAYEPFMKVINGGYKDLTTDEAYALANGIRALMTGVRGKAQSRQDARLAEKVTAERNKLGLNDVPHSAAKPLADEIDIRFKNDELQAIHDAGPRAGTVLRETLKAKGADPNKLEVSDEALLTRFGFTVNKNEAGQITGALSPEGYTLDTHTRRVGMANAGESTTVKLKREEIDHILAGNEDAGQRLRIILRENYNIDPKRINTDDAKLLEEFGFSVSKHLTGANKGKIAHVKEQSWRADLADKVNPKEQYTRRGWITDLWKGANNRRQFIDAAMADQRIRPQLDALMTSDESTRALQRAYARSQFRIGEQPTVGDKFLGIPIHRLRPNLDSETNRSKVKAETSSQSSTRTGGQSGSAQEGNLAGGSPTETTPVQNTAPTPVPPTAPATPVQTNTAVETSTKKTYSAPSVKDRTSEIIAKRKAIAQKNASKKVAANLEKLRNSKDPMLTLKQISEQEAKDMYKNAEPELIEAIEASIQDMWDRGVFRSQNEVSYYRNNIYNLFKGFYKKGGVIKAQNGYPGFDPNWQVPGWDPNYGKPEPQPWESWRGYPWKQPPKVSLWPDNLDPIKQWDKESKKVADDISTKTDEAIRANHNGFNPYWKPDKTLFSSKVTQDLSGGFNDDISDKTKWLNPMLSAVRYGLNAWAQKKNLEQATKMLNAGRWQELATWANAPTNTNPTLDRQLQQVHQERMAGLSGIPATNDWIAHNAILNQKENQLWDRENDIFAKQSAHQWDVARETLNIMNQNLDNSIKVANQNAARRAAINSAIEQQKMAFIQQLNQSRQNALLEVQNNIANDRKTMLAYNQQVFSQNLERDFDSFLRTHYPMAASTYASLDWSERAKYTDLEDYIMRNVPGAPESINKKRQEMMRQIFDWNRSNTLNYDYGWLTGKSSSVGNRTYKKGGRVNGSTRYTLEPDERIWVDNNKATHAAVAKLNDNTIKLLLRALK